MAGYMRKLQGYVYNGDYVSGETLENGVGAAIVTDNGNLVVKKLTAKGNTEFRVHEKTTLWGKDALVLDVIKLGGNDEYLVENEWDICEFCNYNTAEYTLPVGKLVRMHRLLEGEQFITDEVAAATFTALAVGDTVVFGANGLIVAK